MVYPCSVSDFQTFFARDFNFAPANDDSNIDQYICTADITRAITEANIHFNDTLFSDPATVFVYLVAFHLVSNLQNSAKGISSQSKFPISSSNVGSVSFTFAIPERYSKDAFIQSYTTNGYGMKYLSFALPVLVAVASAGYRQTSSR